MTNNNSTYKRLGDYIREVDVRNSDLRCTNLLGLSNAKVFIPSIANMVGTDLRPYKIVKHNQFAYVPVTSRNGEKITVALYTGDEPAIISQAYVVFEIVGTCDTVETLRATSLQCDQLLPEYLMMWFRRAEFDRYARFHSHGSAREVFDWEEMCNVQLPVPSIEEQRRIVLRYQAIQNRIENNKKTIVKLEETAQALYRKMFVDGIDVENLPEGWRMEPISNVCDVLYGFPFNSELFTDHITEVPIVRIRDLSSNQTATYTTEKVDEKYLIKEKDILIGMDGNFYITSWSAGKAYVNQRVVRIRPKDGLNIPTQQIVFSITKPIKELESSIEGTTVAHLSDKDIKALRVLAAEESLQKDFYRQMETISKNQIVLKRENRILTEILSLLMVGMGR